jgi:hypothetical protein
MTKANTMTRDQAIAMLVEQDVEQWGETERAASMRLRQRENPTLGLALNALASRAELADDPAAAGLRTAADAALTAEDWRVLRGSD